MRVYNSLVFSSYFPTRNKIRMDNSSSRIMHAGLKCYRWLAHSSTMADRVLGFSKSFESFNQVNFLFRQMLCSLSIFCYLDVQFIQFVTACHSTLFSESKHTHSTGTWGHVVTDNSHTALSAHKVTQTKYTDKSISGYRNCRPVPLTCFFFPFSMSTVSNLHSNSEMDKHLLVNLLPKIN